MDLTWHISDEWPQAKRTLVKLVGTKVSVVTHDDRRYGEYFVHEIGKGLPVVILRKDGASYVNLYYEEIMTMEVL